MKGLLRKFVDKVKIFQKTMYPKRFFIIDFRAAILYIKNDENTVDTNKIKEIPFCEILECYLPKHERP